MPPSRMETPARRSLLLLGGLAAGGMLAGCGMWPEEQKDKKPVLYLYRLFVFEGVLGGAYRLV